jgi:ADP-ribose pyrophosphatase
MPKKAKSTPQTTAAAPDPSLAPATGGKRKAAKALRAAEPEAALPVEEKAPKALSGKAKVLDSKISFAGRIFNVTSETVTEPGGVTSTREVIRHSGSVVILAVDASRSKKNPMILIERQYRHAAGQFLFELPAGRIEPGEKPLAAAKRELIEETGFRAKTWSKLTRYYASPGFLAELMEVYLAEDIRAGEAQPEDDEKIELAQIPLRDLLRMIDEGKILDGKTILSVLLYASRVGAKKA